MAMTNQEQDKSFNVFFIYLVYNKVYSDVKIRK